MGSTKSSPSLVPMLYTPRFYFAAMEKNRFFSMHGCEIKSVSGLGTRLGSTIVSFVSLIGLPSQK